MQALGLHHLGEMGGGEAGGKSIQGRQWRADGVY